MGRGAAQCDGSAACGLVLGVISISTGFSYLSKLCFFLALMTWLAQKLTTVLFTQQMCTIEGGGPLVPLQTFMLSSGSLEKGYTQ